MADGDIPYWIKYVRNCPEAQHSFLAWIDEQKHTYELFAIRQAKTLEELHAARSTYEELDMMARMMTWEAQEESEYARLLATAYSPR